MKLRKKLVRDVRTIEDYPVTYLYDTRNPERIYDVLVKDGDAIVFEAKEYRLSTLKYILRNYRRYGTFTDLELLRRAALVGPRKIIVENEII
jgi:hypothetical protein